MNQVEMFQFFESELDAYQSQRIQIEQIKECILSSQDVFEIYYLSVDLRDLCLKLLRSEKQARPKKTPRLRDLRTHPMRVFKDGLWVSMTEEDFEKEDNE